MKQVVRVCEHLTFFLLLFSKSEMSEWRRIGVSGVQETLSLLGLSVDICASMHMPLILLCNQPANSVLCMCVCFFWGGQGGDVFVCSGLYVFC